MSPSKLKIRYRPNSQDAGIYREVWSCNEYRLPARFTKRDVIVDIGAHIGIFSCAVLARGAGKVIALEPDPANFALLAQNLKRFRKRVILMQAAAWRSDQPPQILSFSGYPAYFNACGAILPAGATGAPGYQGNIPVATVSLDLIISEIASKGQRIRLLKIDAEGAEYPILYTSKMLAHVDEISCEAHHMGGASLGAQVPGFQHHDAAELAAYLQTQAFNVQVRPNNSYPTANLKVLFAKRSGFGVPQQ